MLVAYIHIPRRSCVGPTGKTDGRSYGERKRLDHCMLRFAYTARGASQLQVACSSSWLREQEIVTNLIFSKRKPMLLIICSRGTCSLCLCLPDCLSLSLSVSVYGFSVSLSLSSSLSVCLFLSLSLSLSDSLSVCLSLCLSPWKLKQCINNCNRFHASMRQWTTMFQMANTVSKPCICNRPRTTVIQLF